MGSQINNEFGASPRKITKVNFFLLQKIRFSSSINAQQDNNSIQDVLSFKGFLDTSNTLTPSV